MWESSKKKHATAPLSRKISRKIQVVIQYQTDAKRACKECYNNNIPKNVCFACLLQQQYSEKCMFCMSQMLQQQQQQQQQQFKKCMFCDVL